MYFDNAFHYPPEVTQLLIETIPLLCRSKRDVLLFFKGAGVENRHFSDIEAKLAASRESVNKYEIARTIIERINHQGTAYLAQRRELIKRVVEYEDFSLCWPADQLKAKGLVSELGRVVNIKDSFTRLKQEQELERRKEIEKLEVEINRKKDQRTKAQELYRELLQLLSEANPQSRGKKLEAVLNSVFVFYGLAVKESFENRGLNGQGVTEQIDGVVEHNSHLYLVEMKWWKEKIGPGDVAHHLVRVFSRSPNCRGIFISYSGFTEAALISCTESLRQAVFILVNLQEIVVALERNLDLSKIIKSKVEAAILQKNPLHNPIEAGEQLDM